MHVFRTPGPPPKVMLMTMMTLTLPLYYAHVYVCIHYMYHVATTDYDEQFPLNPLADGACLGTYYFLKLSRQ